MVSEALRDWADSLNRAQPSQLGLGCSASQDTHAGNVSSSSSPRSTTTSTPFLTEYGTSCAKSRALTALNVSKSCSPPPLQASFVEKWAIMISVSAHVFTYEMRSSGSTLLWMTKVIRDRTIGEVKRVLIILGGSSLMCCSSMRNSVKDGQRLKSGRRFEDCSPVSPEPTRVRAVMGLDN